MNETPDLSAVEAVKVVAFGMDVPEPADWPADGINYSEWWSNDGGVTNAVAEVRNDGNVLVQVGLLRSLLRQSGYESVRTEAR